MTADLGEQGGARPVSSEADLRVNLERPLPLTLPVARATAIFCAGTCFHRYGDVQEVEVVVDGNPHRVTAARMPRLDLFQALHPGLTGEQRASARLAPGSSEDPELRCYRSGFWATIPIEPRARPGRIELRVNARLDDGTLATAPLGAIEVAEPKQPGSYEALPRGGDAGAIAICMATFEPDVELFRAQVDSIRAQTDTNWICLISDDCSRPDRFQAIEETVAEDPRFVVSRSEARLGFYRNFERALEMAPAEAQLVALCDHDDRWYPDKLEILRGALGSAQLVYSDQRLVDHDGRVLADTFWEGRRNNYKYLPSLLVANTITGAATLFRREVLDFALPFPDVPWPFHDHWLGLVAMATGDIAYVDRPLYDYVQHAGAILGQVAVGPDASSEPPPRGRRRPSLRRLRQFLSGWRAAYFCAYLRLEVLAQVLLARCSDELTPRKRRALERFVGSDRSPFALAWLAARPLRALVGRNETLGTEAHLVRGILWRHIIAARAWRQERPTRRSGYDASLPPCGPDSLGQKRLRRWRGQARAPRQRTPTGSL